MKKIFSVLLIALFTLTLRVNATTYNGVYVNLDKLEYSYDNKNFKSITEYKSFEDFLKDYNSDNLESIYITNFLFDGVSGVKLYDLDDYIEEDSNDIKIKSLEIQVINVNTTGNIEFTGTIKGAMVGVNTNDRIGDINIILNNANIDTDSKKAPAIYVYNKDKNYTDCKVTIKTLAGTENYIEGGKLKKVSLIPSDKLEEYSSYYTDDNLDNYNKYSSYYGVYTSDEINNLLFAVVQADSEGLDDGDPYYYYKGSGAISSDIDLCFEGEGFLRVTSKNDEGIESKGNLTFSGGTGDYEIFSEDDGLNTTTPSGRNTAERNDLIIDVHSLLVKVSEKADEGDAIDSNGRLIIKGGNIYAFAHPTTNDAGLDSGNRTYINGGTIIATGNMVDRMSIYSEQNYIFTSFDQIEANTLIVIKNQKDEIITAFKTSRTMKNLVYSSKDLNYKSYKIYIGGTIDGEETNGLYTKINSYSGGEEISYVDVGMIESSSQNVGKNVLKILFFEVLLLAIALIVYIKIGDDKE